VGPALQDTGLMPWQLFGLWWVAHGGLRFSTASLDQRSIGLPCLPHYITFSLFSLYKALGRLLYLLHRWAPTPEPVLPDTCRCPFCTL